MANAIIGISRNLVLWQRAEKEVAQNGGGGLLLAGYLESHRTVNTHHACSSHGVEQYSDIPMTNQPFGVLLKAFLWDTVLPF